MLDAIDIRGIKTGMLYDAENTRRVARKLKVHYGDPSKVLPLFVDPVATSGHTLLHPDAIPVMIEQLFPLATLITPNTPESELLLLLSRKVLGYGSKTVLVKGGHVNSTLANVDQLAAARPDVTVVRENFLDDAMEILRANEAGHRDIALRPPVVDVLRTVGERKITSSALKLMHLTLQPSYAP